MKIHELAKKLNANSKEILEKAKALKIDVKSHLSSISEEEANKIEKAMKKEKEVKEKKNEEKNEKKKEREKASNQPVIIRREVIINDQDEKKNEMKKKEHKKSDIGFVEEKRNKDYNIVYREKTKKPMSVAEFFGIPKKENKKDKEKNKEKVEEKVTESVTEKVIENESKNETVIESAKTVSSSNATEKVEEKTEKIVTTESTNPVSAKPQEKANNMKQNNYQERKQNVNNGNSNMGFRRNNNGSNSGNSNNYKNNRNNNNSYQNGKNSGYQNNRNNNFQGRNNERNNDNNYRQNRNDRNGNNGNGQRRIDRDIKDIMSTEFMEKENVREYSNKAIDKQKSNRNYNNDEQRVKKNRRRENDEDFSEDKLRHLKKESTLSNVDMLDYYDLTTQRGRRSEKKSKSNNRNKQKIFKLTEITIPSNITVKDLAAEMKITSGEVIKKLLSLGALVTINQEIDFDMAYLVAAEFGITAKKKDVVREEDVLFDESEDSEDELITRAPVVCVMGHVDHGKTSLLDAIRSTNVIEGESGGITQHIGAYKVEINGRPITFLDTPGHEAFTSMRARGAQITDIVILVVAANDGVMPQTVEAINHAKATNVPIIVAVNKIDLEGADVEKIKRELTEYELVPEEWGGNTIYVPISAKKHIGIESLLEMVLLQADMLELKVNPHKQAKGTVIEAKLDKTRGPVATLLVQRGSLDLGDTIVVGSSIGRIRAMTNDKGVSVKQAGPSTPVEVIGLTTVPNVGETCYEVKDEKMAKHLIERRKRQEREKELNKTSMVTLDNLFSQMEEGKIKQLNLIVKADVQGSVEAVKQSLEKLSNDEVQVKVIHSNVGGVTESDVILAKVSNAIIIAFNVRPDPIAKSQAEKDEVEIKTYSVIYNAIEDVETAMKGMLDPVYKEVIIGNAEVRQTFKVSNVGTIAGCYVLDGKIARNSVVRVIRDNVVLYEGKLISLKRFKDDVKEVVKGYECGVQIEGYNDILEGDIIEAHVMEEVKR